MARKKYYDENGNVVKKRGGCLKWVGIAIAILLVIGIAGSIFGEGGNGSSEVVENSEQVPNEPISEGDGSKEKAEDETSNEPEIEVTATEIIDTFEANELKGKEEYTGKRARITGTIDDIGESFNQVYITLGTDTNEYSFIGLQVFFPEDKQEGLSDLSAGDTVTLDGTIGEQSVNIEVKDAELVQ